MKANIGRRIKTREKAEWIGRKKCENEEKERGKMIRKGEREKKRKNEIIERRGRHIKGDRMKRI